MRIASSDRLILRPTSLFDRFAKQAEYVVGHPKAFVLAACAIVVWAATGPFFGYSDTWQLVINTATTIVTFLGFPDSKFPKPGQRGDSAQAR